MLTINADNGPQFRDYYQAGKEKCVVVVLSHGVFGDRKRAHRIGSDDELGKYQPACRVASGGRNSVWIVD